MARKLNVILANGQAEYFCREDWTTQISLNRLAKLVFTRRSRPSKIIVKVVTKPKL
jgi:hypothetical protein